MHFYNSRDVLPPCLPNDAGEETTYRPVPEPTANMKADALVPLIAARS